MSAPAVQGPAPGTDERTYWAGRVWLPWIDAVKPLRDATVLEYGCGPGSVSRAVAPRVKRHIGLDIDPVVVDINTRMAREAGQENSEAHAHPPEEIIDVLRGYAGEVDVLLLYAVLEHLTLAERLEVLAVAREVARPHGVIAVVELPNRLAAFDQHSSWLPFVTQLPDDLAIDYLERATRPQLRDEVLAFRDRSIPAAEDEEALMALRRFGRGVSFHEFELAWGGRIDGYALATNWGPDVIPHREIDPGEVALARSLARLRPDLDPTWSRQWIDVVLSPDLPVRRPRQHRPWTGHAGPASRGVSRDLADVVFLPSAHEVLHVELPEATEQIAVRVVDGEQRTVVEATTLRGEVATGEAASPPGAGCTVVVDLPGWADDLLLRLPRGGWILGVTYAGHGPAA